MMQHINSWRPRAGRPRAAARRRRRNRDTGIERLGRAGARRGGGVTVMPSVVLLGYDLDQPSFRHRMRSLMSTLEAAGWQVRAERFPSGRYGLRTWERRR